MESIWTAETKIREREALPGDMEVDAVVIGAGMAGVLSAYYLHKEGVRTVVLEADRIGSGQTKNTTAKITSQHGLLYDRIIQTMGTRKAFAYAWANEEAIDEYERLILEKGIDCDFTRCPSYLYSRTKENPLRREAVAAAKAGINASFETECELPFAVAGAVRFEKQARFDPLKFLAAMAEEVTVYEKTRVHRVVDNRVETDRGCVTARHIIFASHFPFVNVPGFYFARMYQERSYVVALEGAEKMEGMYMGIDRDRLSFRSQGDLLLLGGARHRTGANRKGGQYEILRSQAQELYPGCRETAHWSAQDCMTLDGLPYVGRFSERRPGWYVATGFGKWGMSMSMASAGIISALILEKKSPVAYAFSPQREFSPRMDRLFSHVVYTLQGMTKHLLPSGKKVFVSNCPHMGCRLEWNPEEETWDCPCHGSRFDQEGRLIDDPAKKDCRRR